MQLVRLVDHKRHGDSIHQANTFVPLGVLVFFASVWMAQEATPIPPYHPHWATRRFFTPRSQSEAGSASQERVKPAEASAKKLETRFFTGNSGSKDGDSSFADAYAGNFCGPKAAAAA